MIRRRGLSVASLPQYVEGDGRTPMEVVRAARPEISEVRGELADCEEQLGAPEVAADLRRMQRVLERQDRLLQPLHRARADRASRARRAATCGRWGSVMGTMLTVRWGT